MRKMAFVSPFQSPFVKPFPSEAATVFPLLTNLVSYWSLDEASGNALDAHSTNHLTDRNTVGSAAGRVGNARQFVRASSEYFYKGSNSALQAGNIDFAFQLWLYPNSTPGVQWILSKASGGVDGEYLLKLDGLIFFRMGNGSVWTDVSVASSGIGVWQHLIFWYTASDQKLRISSNNGATQVSTALSYTPTTTTNSFYIGSLTGVSAFVDGRVDEVGFWKRLLTDAERTWLYNSGNGRSYAEIAAYTG